MGDKVKFVFFDKEMREEAERLGIDKMTTEEFLQNLNECAKDPDNHELLSILEKSSGTDIIKLFKESMKTQKKLGKEVIGMQDRNGRFICCFCMSQEDWDGLIEDEVITLGDLKFATFYQCANCKRKFSMDGVSKFIKVVSLPVGPPAGRK